MKPSTNTAPCPSETGPTASGSSSTPQSNDTTTTTLSLGNYSRQRYNHKGTTTQSSSTTKTPPSPQFLYSTVTNLDDPQTNNNKGRHLFDEGLRLLFSYFHEAASHRFLACTKLRPHCALAYAFAALCHGPNYNFRGDAYYDGSHYVPEEDEDGRNDCLWFVDAESDVSGTLDFEREREGETSWFPSRVVADYCSARAVEIVEELEAMDKNRPLSSDEMAEEGGEEKEQTTTQPQRINDVETQLIHSIRILLSQPNISPSLSLTTVEHPYAHAMKNVHSLYPTDPDIAYFYAESLMVLNAWELYDYPSGTPRSENVPEIRRVLEYALGLYPDHMGLCHLYVHLCEMSSRPGDALGACGFLKTRFPDAGHLIHMATHIDVLLGNYESCITFNEAAIRADTKAMTIFPKTASPTSFYFGYIVHNYHMLIYGAILGAMEAKGTECAKQLNVYLTESLFVQNPQVCPYLESYASTDVHVLVRFGRWDEILNLDLPVREDVMVYRTAILRKSRALAYANTGNLPAAREEAERFERIRERTDVTSTRILHNNTVKDLLDVESLMVRGELEYFEGRVRDAFGTLRNAVSRQDALCYDEPWGVMQPVRHTLGGLLLRERVMEGCSEEAEEVFRSDLTRHPKNPWALVGLLSCIERRLERMDVEHKEPGERQSFLEKEHGRIRSAFREQRESKWADFHVTCSCMCAVDKCCTKVSY